MQYSAKDLNDFLRPLAAMIGVPGFIVVVTSLKSLRRRMQDGRVMITSIICALIGLSMMGLAVYIINLGSNLPAK